VNLPRWQAVALVAVDRRGRRVALNHRRGEESGAPGSSGPSSSAGTTVSSTTFASTSGDGGTDTDDGAAPLGRDASACSASSPTDGLPGSGLLALARPRRRRRRAVRGNFAERHVRAGRDARSGET
jgi:hypothetical protein